MNRKIKVRITDRKKGQAVSYDEHSPNHLEWIKCSVEMPEECTDVLVFETDYNEIHIAGYNRSTWFCPDGLTLDANDVSHWMPLPLPPK